MDDGLYLDLLKRCLIAYPYNESSYVEIRPTRSMPLFKKVLTKTLARKGYKIFKVMPFDAETRELGKDWPCFGFSMVGMKRLDNLQACVEAVLKEKVPGDLIETGVWRGGACILMKAVLRVHEVKDRDVYLADSFEGLPAPTLEADHGYDLSENKYLAVAVDDVKAAFQRFGLLDSQVKFLKGWFKDTLGTADISRLALLRLDGDLYESTRDVLHALYHKVVDRGFVIVDDYHTWPPCRAAVDEFRARNGIEDPIQEIDGSGVFWRKSPQGAMV